MKKIISIGEALIDFIPNRKGCGLKDVTGFERVCGGAPANLACAAAKLGGSSALISCVGNDGFGSYIIETLANAGVDTSMIVRTDKANTTLAFVSLKQDGNREFSFYRNPGADMLLDDNHLNIAKIKECGILHFCSVALVESPTKYAHKKAIALAKENGAVISFDPNIRLPLWSSASDCRAAVREFLPLADVVKISDEELEFVTGIKYENAALKSLLDGGAAMVLYSLGAKGARLITRKADVFCPAPPVKAVDTTGAGDACIGSLLFRLAKDDLTPAQLSEIPEEKLREYLAFSVGYSALSVTKKGAVSSYCDYETTINFIRERT